MKKIFNYIVAAFDVRDAIVFGGLFMCGYGSGLIYAPAGFIVIGSGMFWLGVRK